MKLTDQPISDPEELSKTTYIHVEYLQSQPHHMYPAHVLEGFTVLNITSHIPSTSN